MWTRFREFLQDLPAALVILNPTKGIGLILRNCVHLDGKLSLERAKAELVHLIFFILLITVVPLAYISMNIFVIWSVHKYIVPIPMVLKIFNSFSVNEENWETNIEQDIAPMENMSRQYDEWNAENGVSTEASEMMQKMLWHSWPLYLVVGLFMGIAFYLIVVRFCLSLVKDYHRNLIRRKMAYFDRDLRFIPREKIL
jgi:hypothetical protein